MRHPARHLALWWLSLACLPVALAGAPQDTALALPLVRAGDLHPTQLSIGRDQVLADLARKQPDLQRFTAATPDSAANQQRLLARTERKRVDDYCALLGQGGVASWQTGQVRLDRPDTYACTLPAPTQQASPTQLASIKTAVIGPGGTLYLTDGHHSVSTLLALADGGPDLPVRVRITDDFSHLDAPAEFWQAMQARGLARLVDAQGHIQPPTALPSALGLDTLQDDPYRTLVALTRGLAYDNAALPAFAEFYWADWLRREGFDLQAYDRDDLRPARVLSQGGVLHAVPDEAPRSYSAAVRDAALRMRAVPADTEIAPGLQARQLGQQHGPADPAHWNAQLAAQVWRDDTDARGRYRTAGKAWYARQYRACGGAPAAAPACWHP